MKQQEVTTFRDLEDFSSTCSSSIRSRHGFYDRDVSKGKRASCMPSPFWRRWRQSKRVSRIYWRRVLFDNDFEAMVQQIKAGRKRQKSTRILLCVMVETISVRDKIAMASQSLPRPFRLLITYWIDGFSCRGHVILFWKHSTWHVLSLNLYQIRLSIVLILDLFLVFIFIQAWKFSNKDPIITRSLMSRENQIPLKSKEHTRSLD